MSLVTFLLSHHVSSTLKITVNFRFERYWRYCLINFWNFHTVHVFEAKESIADISTELACLGYLKNLGQLPVQEYFKGTDVCILWIFTIFPLFMFSRSRNPLVTFLLSYLVWVTSVIQANSRFERYWWFCLINCSSILTSTTPSSWCKEKQSNSLISSLLIRRSPSLSFSGTILSLVPDLLLTNVKKSYYPFKYLLQAFLKGPLGTSQLCCSLVAGSFEIKIALIFRSISKHFLCLVFLFNILTYPVVHDTCLLPFLVLSKSGRMLLL